MAKKILVVDDEQPIVRLLQVNLERNGYEVITASNGKEALEQVALEQPDMLVLDVMMPFMDGFEVMQVLKASPATREIPVIMLTARSQDMDIYQGWKSGVDCYLIKPCNPTELVMYVKRIFQTIEEDPVTPTVYADLWAGVA